MSQVELLSFAAAGLELVAAREPVCRRLTEHEKWFLANSLKAAPGPIDRKLVDAYRHVMDAEVGCDGGFQNSIVQVIKQRAARY